jgi:hypothetical protein
MLPCIDIQGTGSVKVDGPQGVVLATGLAEFEARYFNAQRSIPIDAFTSDQLTSKSLLGGNEDEKAQHLRVKVAHGGASVLAMRSRRDTNTTCTPDEFELVAPTLNSDRVCEYVSTCTDGQELVEESTSQADTTCQSVRARTPVRITVRVRGATPDGSALHGVTVGTGRHFEVKDSRRPGVGFVAQADLQLTQLETYEFVMEDVPEANPFILTLDPAGGPSAARLDQGIIGNSGATTGQSVTFVPGPSMPATVYYQSSKQSDMGAKLNIGVPAFSQRHTGTAGDGLRFTTGFSRPARLFEHSAVAGDEGFAGVQELCKQDCTVIAACKGVFVYATPYASVCYGLSDVSGSGTPTKTQSLSLSKVV